MYLLEGMPAPDHSGGTKAKAGKNRIVPIHPKIRPLVEARLAEGGEKQLYYGGKPVTISKFREIWRETMEQMGMEHVLHECRHTFEGLLDAAGAVLICLWGIHQRIPATEYTIIKQ